MTVTFLASCVANARWSEWRTKFGCFLGLEAYAVRKGSYEVVGCLVLGVVGRETFASLDFRAEAAGCEDRD